MYVNYFKYQMFSTYVDHIIIVCVFQNINQKKVSSYEDLKTLKQN